jgi:MOSC domain-containing protein YiiM
MSGRVEAIWLKPVRRQPMKAVDRATLVANRGMVGNANQNGRRQVTIITKEQWRAAEERLGLPVDPASRRANIMISGIDLSDSRAKQLRIGECLIDIWGETRPCERMDAAEDGLQDALRPDWSGGVFGVILEGGEIAVGDEVELLPEPEDSALRAALRKRDSADQPNLL